MRATRGPLVAEELEACLRSIVDRLWMATYHYQQARELLSTHLDKPNRIHPMLLEFGDPDMGAGYRYDRKAAYAHVSACLQNIHSLGDTFAHTIYLVLDLSASINKGRVSTSEVIKAVKTDSNWNAIASKLTLLWDHADFNYIAAVVNRSKHQNLLSPDLVHNFADEAEMRWKLEMRAFDSERMKAHFLQCDLLPFLQKEVSRQSALMREIGFLLDAVVEGRTIKT